MSFAIHLLKTEKYCLSMSGLETDCPLWPYLLYFIRQAKDERRKDPGGVEKKERKLILNGFLSNLIQRLMSVANNVLVIESKILEQSANSQPIGRFQYYSCIRENNSYLIDLLTAYPELDRLLSTITERFITNLKDFYTCYCLDRDALLEFLSLESSITLSCCDVSEGETHNGGKTVVILTFGMNKKVVFKPRDVEAESAVSLILENMSKLAGPTLSNWLLPRYWPRGEYGWMQYTGQQAISVQSDAEIFYIRMGFLLAFCTSVTASDMTSDNVIAHGAHPVPVDLETVFYSVLKQHNIPREIRWNASLTSILPNWTWKGTDGVGVDLSALGGLSEQYVSMNLYQCLSQADRDSFGMSGVRIMPNKNVLNLDGKPVEPWKYEKEIIEGFDKYFQLVKFNPRDLIDRIQSLRGIRVRYVPRATATYHYAIQCSFHPTLMTSTDARKKFLESILNSDTPPAKGFLASEIAACMDNDIPYAMGSAGSLEFKEPYYGGCGYLEEDCFQDGISHSHDYIETFTDQRLAFEKKLITNSLIAMRSMYDHGYLLSEKKFRQTDPLDDVACFDADFVFESLEKSLVANIGFICSYIQEALNDNGLWLGFHASSGGHIEYSELGDDFYYGITGILFGCMVIKKIDSNLDFLDGLKNLCYERVMAKLNNAGAQLGGFHFGLASSVIPLYLSLKVSDDDQAESLLVAFKAYVGMVLEDELWQKYFMGNDLMSGVSGCIAVLTTLHRLSSDPAWAVFADMIFEKGCSSWVDEKGKLSLSFDKSVTVRDDGLMSGVSHGVMGCAYCLYYYSINIHCNRNVEKVANALLEWEIACFDERICNWPDYRVRTQADGGEFAWSHGLPGNYLVLDYLAKNGVVRAQEFMETHPVDEYLNFDSLAGRKRPVNDSMCHGALGLLNIIKQLSSNCLLDHRIYFWTNVINFSEQDCRELRVRTADPLGLWVGKVGSIFRCVRFVGSAI